MYRTYSIILELNGIYYTELLIDPHYELKHKKSINDDVIIALVFSLHKLYIDEQIRTNSGYSFYEIDIEFESKLYRLILTTPPDHSFLGVRNAYRRSK